MLEVCTAFVNPMTGDEVFNNPMYHDMPVLTQRKCPTFSSPVLFYYSFYSNLLLSGRDCFVQATN